MARGLGLLTLVASLVISALLFSSQWSGLMGTKTHNGQPKPVQDAYAAAAGVYAASAEHQLEAYKSQYGTYFGAPLAARGVTLLRADESSYCFRIDVPGTVPLYEAGPGGGVVSQPCA